MVISSSTANLPTLTPDNFAQIEAEYTRIPVDLALVPTEDRAKTVSLLQRSDILDAGEPSRWIAWQEDDGTWLMSLDSKFPCSIPWCRGHGTNEADSWDSLTHSTEDVKMDDLDAGLSIAQKGDRTAFHVFIHHEAEVDIDDLVDLEYALNRLVALLESQLAVARQIQGGQITQRGWDALAQVKAGVQR